MSTTTVSQRKIEANRRNAQKSTGPKTPEGKARSSKNATSHGIFCKDTVLGGEDENAFHALRTTYLIKFAPQDGPELALVDAMVNATWKLRRLDEAEALIIEVRMDELLEETGGGDVSPGTALADLFMKDDQALERLSKYQQRLQNQVHRAMRELRQLRDPKNEKTNPRPESPFLHQDHIEVAQDDEEENLDEKYDAQASNVQNEPTAVPPPACPLQRGTQPSKLSNRTRSILDRAIGQFEPNSLLQTLKTNPTVL